MFECLFKYLFYFFVGICSVFVGYIHECIAVLVIFMHVSVVFALKPVVICNIDFFSMVFIEDF